VQWLNENRSFGAADALHPGNEKAVAVSGGGGRIAATPDDETVVAGSGVPGLFGEAGNELMRPAS
jgi:hypothetical protein